MKDLEVYDNPQTIIRESSLCVFQFGSRTCAPCTSIRKKIDEWLKDHTEACAYYIDIEKHALYASQSGIFSVPAVRVYIDGIQVIEKSGYFSLEEVVKDTERYLNLKGE